MSRDRRRRTPRDRRGAAGFTLIELLVVILILGILVALLVPALAGAVGRARDAQVTAEITNISQSLASFQTKYGMYPPSRILVHETLHPDQWLNELNSVGNPSQPIASITALPVSVRANASTSDINAGLLVQRSVQAIKRMFPKIGTPVITGPNQIWHDFNGDGEKSGWLLLEGHECLVFFLGGISTPYLDSATQKTGYGVSGFSKNPAFPFTPPAADGSGNRTQPLYEFKADRLVDNDNDRIPGYLDPRNPGLDGRFFAYFSAYGSNGYDPNDVNFVPQPGQFYVSDEETFGRSTRVTTGAIAVWSPAPNPYTTSAPTSTGNVPVFFHNKESFQLISAGVDGVFGPGGQFSADTTGIKLPVDSAAIGISPTNLGAPADVRRSEQDNLTNFAQSKLD